MLNNIKNSPLASLQRLNGISHHFLGDSPETSSNRRVPFFLPILVDEINHKKIILKLNHELLTKGLSSCIVNTNNIYKTLMNHGLLLNDEAWSNPFGDIDNHNIGRDAYEIARKQIIDNQKEDIYLIPYSFCQSFVPVLFGKAVIITASTIDEIRSAYGDIKHLNKHGITSIDIIMTYSDDKNKTSQYFSKLDEGVKKFLGFNVYNSGHIKIENQIAGESSNDIDKIACRIISRWELTKLETGY